MLLLGGIVVDRSLLGKPIVDSGPYQQRVRQSVDQFPRIIGGWISEESPVPEGAIALLKPNAIVSRSYTDMKSGQTVGLLLVHCEDARDLLGHFPPNCYGGQGWSLEDAQPHDWDVDGRVIRGMQYRFVKDEESSVRRIWIDNFMLLPNGLTARDMDGVDRSARDSTLKYFGAGQLQLIRYSEVGNEEREREFSLFVHEARNVIDMILQPVPKK